jgi:hypothetical protein
MDEASSPVQEEACVCVCHTSPETKSPNHIPKCCLVCPNCDRERIPVWAYEDHLRLWCSSPRPAA